MLFEQRVPARKFKTTVIDGMFVSSTGRKVKIADSISHFAEFNGSPVYNKALDEKVATFEASAEHKQ